MQFLRSLCCAALALGMIGGWAQDKNGNNDDRNNINLRTGAANDQLNINSPVDDFGILCFSQKVLVEIQTENISAGNEVIVIATLDSDPTKKTQSDAFQCPNGCAQNTLRPCLDFAGIPDGVYTLTAMVRRISDGTVLFSDTEKIQIDRVPPTIDVTMNPNKSCYSSKDTNIQVHFTASDACKIRSYKISGAIVESGGAANSYDFNRTLNASLLPDGNYSITFEVHDNVGDDTATFCPTGSNVSTKTIEFQVDSTPPIVTLNSPGTCLKGTITVNFNVNNSPATTALGNARIFIDGVLKKTQAAVQGVNSFSLDTTTLSDGPHTMKIEVDDACLNTGASSIVNFSVDNTPPTITVTNPSGDPNVCVKFSTTSFTIQFSFNESVTWTLLVDGGTVGLGTTNGSGSSGSSVYTPGDVNCHTFVLTATDTCGNSANKSFKLQRFVGECDCVILPNLIWRTAGTVTDPFDGVTKQLYRPEVLNIDDITLRDVLNCNGVTIDQNLIIQTVTVSKVTPLYKCGAFTFGPGSGLNTNFKQQSVAHTTNLDDSVCQVAFKLLLTDRCLGDRCLLFSPPCTLYTLEVQYVIRDPVTGRIGAPIKKEMCWKVELPDKDVIRCNIDYFATVAIGRTQKCKIAADVVQALKDALDNSDPLEGLLEFETVVAFASTSFDDFIDINGPEKGLKDVRFETGYMIDSVEEPVGCLLIEQANSFLWH